VPVTSAPVEEYPATVNVNDPAVPDCGSAPLGAMLRLATVVDVVEVVVPPETPVAVKVYWALGALDEAALIETADDNFAPSYTKNTGCVEDVMLTLEAMFSPDAVAEKPVSVVSDVVRVTAEG